MKKLISKVFILVAVAILLVPTVVSAWPISATPRVPVTDFREVYHPISNEVYQAERSDAGLFESYLTFELDSTVFGGRPIRSL